MIIRLFICERKRKSHQVNKAAALSEDQVNLEIELIISMLKQL